VIDRRAFIVGSVAALAAPLAAGAQPPTKSLPGRIAFLCSDSCTSLPSTQFPRDQAFVRGLERTGYVLGRDIQIDSSAVGIGIDGLTERAQRLVDRKVSVIVVVTTLAGLAARRAYVDPYRHDGTEDPIQEGLVNSLARPGGNVTGLAIPWGQLVAKQIELLREIQPNITRLAVLWDPKAHQTDRLTRIEAALEHLGVRVHRVEFSSHPDTEKALMALRDARADAVLGLEHLANAVARRDTALFALRVRLPMVASTTGFAPSGALVTYGPNLADLFDGASHYVGRILNGAKPSELPIEEPRRFALTLNVGTAKALGVTIPPSLLARVDQVIE
jgi:putative tryptophan/tyrosine transport system substrate-binding protein